MRKLAIAGTLFLAGCATTQPPARGETPGLECKTGDTNQFIGQAGTGEAGAAIMRATQAAVLRWASPGVMLTMDYREDRVTVWLDPAGKITQIKCG
jgi:peptidase inhibitor I78 family protein